MIRAGMGSRTSSCRHDRGGGRRRGEKRLLFAKKLQSKKKNVCFASDSFCCCCCFFSALCCLLVKNMEPSRGTSCMGCVFGCATGVTFLTLVYAGLRLDTLLNVVSTFVIGACWRWNQFMDKQQYTSWYRIIPQDGGELRLTLERVPRTHPIDDGVPHAIADDREDRRLFPSGEHDGGRSERPFDDMHYRRRRPSTDGQVCAKVIDGQEQNRTHEGCGRGGQGSTESRRHDRHQDIGHEDLVDE